MDKILETLREWAPEKSALPNDPVGLLIGRDSPEPVTSLGVCLDITPSIARLADKQGIQLLIAHHPLIYHPLTHLDSSRDPIAQSVRILVKADIACYAMHTNWDRAESGINDTLAQLFELQDIRLLGNDGPLALPRLGSLAAPCSETEFLALTQSALGCSGTSTIRYTPINPKKVIKRVAVCGGAGAFLIPDVLAAGADAYVTSDIRHHEFLDAAARGLFLIDAGHGATETPGMHTLWRHLTATFPNIDCFWFGDELGFA